jgi:hypothetical protein
MRGIGLICSNGACALVIVGLLLASPQESPPAQSQVVKQHLQQLEGKLRRDSSGRTLDSIRKHAAAAAAFAETVGDGNDLDYLRAFQAAFNAADRIRATPSRAQERLFPVAMAPLPTAGSLYSDPRFITNAKRLIQQRTERVLGGIDTTDFPDCVCVGSSGNWCCSGTLVATNVAVTAGHCDEVCSARVYFGADITQPGKSVKVKQAVRHPEYGVGGKHNDLTVLILEEDVPDVAPRGIAAGNMLDADSVYFVRVVGFGNTDPDSTMGFGKKRVVDVPLATKDCSADPQHTYGCDPASEFVAGAPFLNRDSCNGDSGGPVYIQASDGKWYVAGATSRATANSLHNCGDGGIYVRLDKYADWIRSVPGGHWPGN